MNTLKTILALAGFILAGQPTVVAQTALNHDQKSCCQEVSANEELMRVREGCKSPVGLCASGEIIGDQLLEGSQDVTVLGLAPSAGLPGLEPETTLSLAAERTITTGHGELTLRVVGVFDTARGEFSELNKVTGGTERFKGATGTLWTIGTSDAKGESFEGRLSGYICLN